MYRQAFSKRNLEKSLRKGDFHKIKIDIRAEYRDLLLKQAIVAAKTNFGEPSNPLVKFNLRRRNIFKIDEHSHKVIARKVTWNLRRATKIESANRSSIVKCLKSILSEGVQFRIYRLDVQSFYESFHRDEIAEKIAEISRLSPHTKRLIGTILNRHAEHGGTGLPRGISLSSVLAELMMAKFDQKIKNQPGTFFYARYVDDIVIVTAGMERKDKFLASIKSALPAGLKLNPSPSKIFVSDCIPNLRHKPRSPGKIVFEFDYLGYRFTVTNPKQPDEPRNVQIGISDSKIQKYQIRLSRAFNCFSQDRDYAILIDRIKYLTNNFSVYNARIGKRKLAGIFHSYPLAASNCEGLLQLDRFLRNLTLNKKSRLGARINGLLNGAKKRAILSNLFTRGHEKQSFVHFSASRIGEIKICWKN